MLARPDIRFTSGKCQEPTFAASSTRMWAPQVPRYCIEVALLPSRQSIYAGSPANRSPSRRSASSSGRRRYEVSTNQSTYSDGPAFGSPRHTCPDAFQEPPGASLGRLRSTQQAKRRTQQQHVPAVQGGLARHAVLKLGNDVLVAPQEEQHPGLVVAVPVRITRVQALCELGGSQAFRRVPQARLRPSPEDLDGRVIRVHGLRKIEVTLGPVELAPGQEHVARRRLHPRFGWIDRQGLLGEPARLDPVRILLARQPDALIGGSG